MAQEPSSRDLLEAVKQQESGGRRYDKSGNLLEGPQTKYGTAKGEMQVLDMTNKDPGFGVRPAKDDSPDERARVGEDYLAAMVKRYGDRKTALVAYNWGPGNTDKWLKKGGDFAKLPEETQNYVTKITGSLGSTKLAQATPAKPKSGIQRAVYKAAPLTHPMLSQLGPSFQAAMAVSMLADEGEKEGKSEYEPSESEKMLTEATARPVALAQMDLSYQSPFPEPQKQQQPIKMAAGGLPFAPTVSARPSARAELDAIKKEYDAYALKVADYNTALEKYNAEQFNPYQAQVDAYNAALAKYNTDIYDPYKAAVDKYNADLEAWDQKEQREIAELRKSGPAGGIVISYTPDPYTGAVPVTPADFGMALPTAPAQFSMAAPTGPSVSQEAYNAKMAAAKADAGRRQVALSAAIDPEAYGLSMPKLFADGGPVYRAEGSPDTGEYFQDPMGAPSAPITADTFAKGKEFKAADALKAVKEVGTGVVRNVKNIAQGVSETPYNLVGSVADVGNMVLTPFGLGSAEPTGGSAHLKRLALERGIRQAPPTDPRDQGFYMMGELGASVVNPGPIAAKGGKAAEMLAKDFQKYNQALGPAGVAYAVRNKGTPFVMTKRPDTGVDTFLTEMSNAEAIAFREKYPDINYFDERALQGTEEYKNFIKPIDEPEYFVKYGITDYRDRIALKDDPILSGWFNKAVPSYFRKDFATPEDQLVRAADQGKLLHFEPKKGPRADESAAIEKKKDTYVQEKRKTEGFSVEGEAKTPYGKRVENTIDKAVYPVQIQDIGRESQIPPSLVKFLETEPEKRASELASMADKRLKLSELRKEMLRIRQIGPEYSAYGQPPAVVPKEFSLPDDLLPRFNLAEASNRVARFTRWEDETRARMATSALREDPRLTRNSLQDGKYVGVALPDPVSHPEFKALITDAGCDGGWCTAQEQYALSYGSGKSQLHVVVTGSKNARPVAQISVEEIGKGLDGNPTYSITDIKEKGDTENFLTNPALPAIQEQIKLLENQYGGFRGIHALDKLGMTEIPKSSPVWLSKYLPLSQALDLTNTFREIRKEAIRLNDGSQYVIGKQSDTNNLLEEAVENLFGPQQRATGGMVERQTNTARYI